MYVIHVYIHACLSTDAYVTFNIYSFYESMYVYMYLYISISWLIYIYVVIFFENQADS